jgi:D-alanyl-D-alanine carboxypeptidase
MKAQLALTLLLCTSLLFACEDPDSEDPGPDPVSDPQYVDLPDSLAEAFIAELEDLGAPGVAVAIRHGDTYYAQAFGSRHPDEDDPLSPTALFRIGSVTKMMTATALLTQVDDGTMSLEDTVSYWIPGLELTGNGSMGDISLHELLSHQSGLYDYTPIAGGEEDERLHDATYGEFVDNAYHMAPDGLFWNYSNPNFSLAGLAVEKADGRWYREVVQEDVFEALGMHRSFFLAEEVLADGDYAMASGWDWTGETPGELLVEPDSYDDAWSRPAGYAWSSVLDLSEFGRFLIHGNPEVLSPDLHAQLVAPQVDTQTFLDTVHYGYGVMAVDGRASGEDWLNIQTIGHEGAMPGFATSLLTVPEADLVIAVLANEDFAYFNQAISAVIEELVAPESVPAPDLGIDPADFSDYAGTYHDPIQMGTIEVSQQGESLVVSVPLLDEVGIDYDSQLLVASHANFYMFIRDYPYQVTFLRNPGETGGSTRWLRSRFFVGDREGDSGRAESPPSASRPEFLDTFESGPWRLLQ